MGRHERPRQAVVAPHELLRPDPGVEGAERAGRLAGHFAGRFRRCRVRGRGLRGTSFRTLHVPLAPGDRVGQGHPALDGPNGRRLPVERGVTLTRRPKVGHARGDIVRDIPDLSPQHPELVDFPIQFHRPLRFPRFPFPLPDPSRFGFRPHDPCFLLILSSPSKPTRRCRPACLHSISRPCTSRRTARTPALSPRP